MDRVFVYGTLKRGFGNHRLLREATFVGKAITKKKYSMTRDGIPFVNEDRETSQIHGEVYEVTPEIKEGLDRLEGFRGKRENSFYYRKSIPIFVENDLDQEEEAEIYFSDAVGTNLVNNGIYK